MKKDLPPGLGGEDEIGSLVGRVSRDLGVSLVAFVLGVDEETVAAWAVGESRPHAGTHRALRFTLRAFSIVADADSAGVARAWFTGTNPALDGVSPAEALEEGRYEQVIAAAQAHARTG